MCLSLKCSPVIFCVALSNLGPVSSHISLKRTICWASSSDIALLYRPMIASLLPIRPYRSGHTRVAGKGPYQAALPMRTWPMRLVFSRPNKELMNRPVLISLGRSMPVSISIPCSI